LDAHSNELFYHGSSAEAGLFYTKQYAITHKFGTGKKHEGNLFCRGATVLIDNTKVWFMALTHGGNTVSRVGTHIQYGCPFLDDWEQSFLEKNFNTYSNGGSKGV